MNPHQFPCVECGANSQFDPATQKLACGYCGHQQEIQQPDTPIERLDYHAHLDPQADNAHLEETRVVHCDPCGAQTTLQPNVSASRCPFCDSPIVTQARSVRHLQPQSVIPLRHSRQQAMHIYQRWLQRRWFAPSTLKKAARIEERLQAVYIPYWAYDCQTSTTFAGTRYEMANITMYHTVIEDGQPVSKRKMPTRSQWVPFEGVVDLGFADMLVPASQAIPAGQARKLEPWDLRALKHYRPDYLAGFTTQTYDVDLKDGYQTVRAVMDKRIRQAVERYAGGERQKFTHYKTTYNDTTFRHVLLPVWMASYRYKGKVYRFIINGHSGKMQGQRPWSKWKILRAITLWTLGLLTLLFLMALI